ncbi:hypothetical protein CS022_21340 [Veronia nyctiphanis]|uniref:Thiopeptide-type bacteriocin biosynthesis domain-containing protein n=1 Tax=Veronia nyctiphanis TaxID=1278244 RepID=A0A4Q0YLB1_9GAMM|nr:thiopeptide-type bacteriocin biosynthesis protein [Veronia nyctiphanis]RXJ71213.1 hypothetical protein CS022_21340 [Veronia nyctiphanis]
MWQSHHFFLYDFEQMNHCLATVAASVDHSLLDDLFFIRYWHGGPHLRFRVRAHADIQPLLTELNTYWRQHGQPLTLDAENYYRPYRHQFSGDEGDILYPNGSIQAIDYQPEYTRYGGEYGMPYCEQFFCEDSRRILTYLSQSPEENERVMFMLSIAYQDVAAEFGLNGLSLLHIEGAHATTQSTLVAEKVRQKFEANRPAYQQYYQHYVTEFQHDANIQQLKQSLRTLISSLQRGPVGAIEPILHSLLHMTFNRLGVPPFKESAIRFFVYLTLLHFGGTDERQAS